MKKLLLSLGAVAAVVTPIATVIACSDSTSDPKADVQKEFVSDMALVDSSSTAWVIPEGAKLLKLADGAAAKDVTKAQIEASTETQNNHAVVFKDAVGVGKDLAIGNESSYRWSIDGDKTTVYKVTYVHTIGESAIGVLQATTGDVIERYGFVATKETEGVLIDHDATGLFYYSTTDAFAKTADEIKVTAKDAEHAIRLESLSDEDLVLSFQGALVEVGLTKPTV